MSGRHRRQRQQDTDNGREEVFLPTVLQVWQRQGLTRLSETMLRVERHRVARAFGLVTAHVEGSLPALEALLIWLDGKASVDLPGWDGAFPILIQRMRGDVETFLDAMLSGTHGVASDAARDLMEVEFLLRDFIANPDQPSRWTHADRKMLLRDFGPATVRQREMKRRYPGGGMNLPDEIRIRYSLADRASHTRCRSKSGHRSIRGRVAAATSNLRTVGPCRPLPRSALPGARRAFRRHRHPDTVLRSEPCGGRHTAGAGAPHPRRCCARIHPSAKGNSETLAWFH